MDKYIEISIPADDEGYISFDCPACSERFKVSASDHNDRSPIELHCPLCGLSAPTNDFLTPEVREVIQQHGENILADAVNEMVKGLEQSFRGSKNLTFQRGRDIPKHQIKRLRETPDLTLVEFACCDSTAKVPSIATELIVYCPYCGQVRS